MAPDVRVDRRQRVIQQVHVCGVGGKGSGSMQIMGPLAILYPEFAWAVPPNRPRCADPGSCT